MFLCWRGKLNNKLDDVFGDLESRLGSFLSRHTCIRPKTD